MTRRIVALTALIALTALTGCGVDGPPQAPGATSTPGVSVSGDARVGMRGTW